MPRKESDHLESVIRFADNNALDTSDKFAQVRGFYDIINKNLKQFHFSILFTPLKNK